MALVGKLVKVNVPDNTVAEVFTVNAPTPPVAAAVVTIVPAVKPEPETVAPLAIQPLVKAVVVIVVVDCEPVATAVEAFAEITQLLILLLSLPVATPAPKKIVPDEALKLALLILKYCKVSLLASLMNCIAAAPLLDEVPVIVVAATVCEGLTI